MPSNTAHSATPDRRLAQSERNPVKTSRIRVSSSIFWSTSAIFSSALAQTSAQCRSGLTFRANSSLISRNVKPSSLARSATRPAAKATASSTSASPGSSKTWPRRAAAAPTPNSCAAWPAPNSSSSMTGDRSTKARPLRGHGRPLRPRLNPDRRSVARQTLA